MNSFPFFIYTARPGLMLWISDWATCLSSVLVSGAAASEEEPFMQGGIGKEVTRDVGDKCV